MKVEPADRAHRWHGQRHGRSPGPLNLCYVGSVEEKIYGRLLERLRDRGRCRGRAADVPVAGTRRVPGACAEGKLSGAGLEKRAVGAAPGWPASGRPAMEIPPADLFDIYQRLSQRTDPHRSPVARTTSGTRCPDLPPSSMWMPRPAGCGPARAGPDRASGPPDRHGFDRLPRNLRGGLPDLEGRLHFASYGDPVFHRMLGPRSAPSICPLASGGWPSRFPTRRRCVGYAVACKENGMPAVRLVAPRLPDINGLRIDEEASLTDKETEPVRQALARKAEEGVPRCWPSGGTGARKTPLLRHSQLLLDHL